MDGLNSFLPHIDGLEVLFKGSKVAIIEDGDIIRFTNKHPCKLQSVWKSPTALHTGSMYMRKNSTLTPFISHEIRKLTERGVTNMLQKRYRKLDPTCKPTISTGTSMTLEKIASFFVLFFTLLLVSILIYIFESHLYRKVNPITNADNMVGAISSVGPVDFQMDQTTPLDC